MRYSVKLFGLVTLTALMMPVGQMPGFAQVDERSGQVQNGQTLAQDENAEELKAEADQFFSEAFELRRSSQYQDALDNLQAALGLYQNSILREAFPTESQRKEANTLSEIGSILNSIGQYQLAIDYYESALDIQQDIEEFEDTGTTLAGIGETYTNLGEYEQALSFYQEALEIFQHTNNPSRELAVLNNIGALYHSLGQYEDSLIYYQSALDLSWRNNDYRNERRISEIIVVLYGEVKQHEQLISYYSDSLAARHRENDHNGEGTILNHIGDVYKSLGEYEQALVYYQDALNIWQEIGSRKNEGTTLNNIGLIYRHIGQFEQALAHYQLALTIHREINDYREEANTLSNIGYLFNYLEESELAIIFFKQAINQYEYIRDNIQGLSIEDQQAFADSVSFTYRTLADLLLQQNRILEAQRILDLLKVQELDEYLGGVRGNATTASGIEFWQPEQEILERFNARQQTAIELGRELTQLRQIPVSERTSAQQERIDELVQLEQELNRQFNDFIDSGEILDLTTQLNTTQQQTLNLRDLAGLRENLSNLNAVLIYPLVLEDRLELIITTSNSPPLQRTVEVSQAELNQAILDFRQALEDPRSDAVAPAQKLYQWLIEPLEADLADADLKTIIYAPDGQLRYIPLGALHDGEQWLTQRFAINNITARSLTDLDTEPATQPSVLAGAFGLNRVTVTVGDRNFTFEGLPYASQEVEALSKTIPGTMPFVDDAFSLDAVRSQLNDHDIIHFATHAAFVPGQPEDSFIVFGNGDSPTLADVKNWSLQNVDLVVLSACQTGLGGDFGQGEEILGLGYQFQRAGARAAIASLWKVSDGGTQRLMNEFYSALQQGSSKVEALQQAQVALINSDLSVTDDDRADVNVTSSRTPNSFSNSLSHPYYWAPFILIGNGL